jgi:hypothetical protein
MAGTIVVGGALIGASTNAINGAVSPHYFQVVMGWQDVENIWRASIAQGIFEGLIYGVLFSVIFTLVVGLVSKSRCSYPFAVRHLGGMAIGIYGSWAAGGLIAMALASLSPEFYRRTFIGVPEEFAAMLGYAWVGGSIWGAMFGALVALTVGSLLFAARWRRLRGETPNPGFERPWPLASARGHG